MTLLGFLVLVPSGPLGIWLLPEPRWSKVLVLMIGGPVQVLQVLKRPWRDDSVTESDPGPGLDPPKKQELFHDYFLKIKNGSGSVGFRSECFQRIRSHLIHRFLNLWFGFFKPSCRLKIHFKDSRVVLQNQQSQQLRGETSAGPTQNRASDKQNSDFPSDVNRSIWSNSNKVVKCK